MDSNATSPQDELIEVKLSEKTTVQMKELTGDEQFDADAMIPMGASPIVIAECRAAASVRSLNGEQFSRARTPEDVRRVLRRLTGRELDALLDKWGTLFGAAPIEEAGKN